MWCAEQLGDLSIQRSIMGSVYRVTLNKAAKASDYRAHIGLTPAPTLITLL